MIQLRINNESDLYNPFDPSQTRINGEVYNYLKTFCTVSESKRHLHDTLQIISDSPIDADRAKAAIQNAVKKIRLNLKGSSPKTKRERCGCISSV